MIQVKNLTKIFGRVKAVDDLSFQVRQGEILGFLGPNGAGKTTTMRILTGFFPPTEGEVSINGLDFVRHAQELKRLIGYLPEDVPLYKEMTTENFLSFAASVKGISWLKLSTEIRRVMKLCRIEEVKRRIIGKLSKGFRQRVGLAQALLGPPKVLILDEPTSGLDPKQINEIRELIRSLRGEQTVILSTHILPEVSAVSDRVIIINEGRLIATGNPDELASRLRSTQEVVISFEGSFETARIALEAIPGVLGIDRRRTENGASECLIRCEKDLDLRAEISKALLESGLKLLELRRKSMTLEDIFLKLVTTEAEETVILR